ncbi:hypothetical protein CHS0354_037574 [Potamilus streckersoni]|uniref:Uncharacterized protein n=1 Tax=Potamilus streckersoni TaxID=2493646 RepID=A0AAE0SVN9_9BIVA|nr:hypothetical protein CHS0354_037574 [Potamilus streckersoni]
MKAIIHAYNYGLCGKLILVMSDSSLVMNYMLQQGWATDKVLVWNFICWCFWYHASVKRRFILGMSCDLVNSLSKTGKTLILIDSYTSKGHFDRSLCNQLKPHCSFLFCLTKSGPRCFGHECSPCSSVRIVLGDLFFFNCFIYFFRVVPKIRSQICGGVTSLSDINGTCNISFTIS